MLKLQNGWKWLIDSPKMHSQHKESILRAYLAIDYTIKLGYKLEIYDLIVPIMPKEPFKDFFFFGWSY